MAATASLLSIYDIAKQTGHSAMAIHNAIERLEIKPDQITPSGHRYFSESIVPVLREKMRKPNGQKT